MTTLPQVACVRGAYRRTKNANGLPALFSRAGDVKHRHYEALRAYFVEARPSGEVAKTFGYTPGSFRVLCHQFRRDLDPDFFVSSQRGPRSQPKKSVAVERIVTLRKRNYSVYEISGNRYMKGGSSAGRARWAFFAA